MVSGRTEPQSGAAQRGGCAPNLHHSARPLVSMRPAAIILQGVRHVPVPRASRRTSFLQRAGAARDREWRHLPMDWASRVAHIITPDAGAWITPTALSTPLWGKASVKVHPPTPSGRSMTACGRPLCRRNRPDRLRLRPRPVHPPRRRRSFPRMRLRDFGRLVVHHLGRRIYSTNSTASTAHFSA